jgi:hypothetical protein
VGDARHLDAIAPKAFAWPGADSQVRFLAAVEMKNNLVQRAACLCAPVPHGNVSMQDTTKVQVLTQK